MQYRIGSEVTLLHQKVALSSTKEKNECSRCYNGIVALQWQDNEQSIQPLHFEGKEHRQQKAKVKKAMKTQKKKAISAIYSRCKEAKEQQGT